MNFFRVLLLCLFLPVFGHAATKQLSGPVTSFSDGVGVFGGETLLGETYSVDWTANFESLCGPMYGEYISNLQIGAYSFSFGNWSYTCQTAGANKILYMLPEQSIRISGANASFEGRGSGSINLLADGAFTWGFSFRPRDSYAALISIGGAGDLSPPIPEPSTYALMALGLGAVIYKARRRVGPKSNFHRQEDWETI